MASSFVHTCNAQKTWDCRHFEFHLHVYIGTLVCIHFENRKKTILKHIDKDIPESLSRSILQLISGIHKE